MKSLPRVSCLLSWIVDRSTNPAREEVFPVVCEAIVPGLLVHGPRVQVKTRSEYPTTVGGDLHQTDCNGQTISRYDESAITSVGFGHLRPDSR
jgi:hypothetical protein